MITDAMVKEALRYIGMSGARDEEIEEQIKECFRDMMATIKPRYTYGCLKIEKDDEGIFLQNTSLFIKSYDLRKLFENVSSVYIMAATLGEAVDRQIAVRQKTNMLSAVIMDACASVWIDKVCDEIEQEIIKKLMEQQYLTMRFSPGYGDVPLNASEGILDILQAQKRIGLTLTRTHMLFPTKSVTALVGVSSQKENRHKSCGTCNLVRTCVYRKRGDRCGR